MTTREDPNIVSAEYGHDRLQGLLRSLKKRELHGEGRPKRQSLSHRVVLGRSQRRTARGRFSTCHRSETKHRKLESEQMFKQKVRKSGFSVSKISRKIHDPEEKPWQKTDNFRENRVGRGARSRGHFATLDNACGATL